MQKTLGGDRLGSGNKMKVAMHNYERSTHNLGNAWISTMAPGTLVPFYKKLALNGDTWTIDLNSLIRTMPATGPMFGAYKLQLDMFEVPIRLYNGILHNNWTKIGMDMSVAKIPTLELNGRYIDPDQIGINYPDEQQINGSSLAHYFGIKGIGSAYDTPQPVTTSVKREFNAIPFLAYWDIFKNYYSNKQEERAYYISSLSSTTTAGGDISEIVNISDSTPNGEGGYNTQYWEKSLYTTVKRNIGETNWNITTSNVYAIMIVPNVLNSNNTPYFPWFGLRSTITLRIDGKILLNAYSSALEIVTFNEATNAYYNIPITDTSLEWSQTGDELTIKVIAPIQGSVIVGIGYTPFQMEKGDPIIESFPLDNIDRMRKNVLQITDLNIAYKIGTSETLAPYSHMALTDNSGDCIWSHEMEGLALKTYQSDYFNNWLSTEWVDYINNTTLVTTTGGYFSMDALNLAQKMYNLKNRIAVAGGTYEDWQEAIWGEDALRRAESPMYCGGFSGTIAFEEVVSTADTDTAAAGDQPLGTLAGKGILVNGKHGHIEIHIKEPSYIIGIASITPLINYNQGNDFDMTDILTLNDLHKPELDQIGFQNLMLEKAAWWGKQYDIANSAWRNNVVGKQPAWLDYMTSWGEIHGDFTQIGNLGFMVLGRHYEMGQGRNEGSGVPGQPHTYQSIPVKDFTTYINPSKHNYQFANTKLTARNFWVQIGINATVRRKMSAKLMPNI